MSNLDLRLEQRPGKRKSSPIGPILRRIVGRENSGGASALGVETPIPIPRADFQDRLPPKVETVELLFDESPDEPNDVDVLDPGSGVKPPAEIEVVIPLNAIDLLLHLRTCHAIHLISVTRGLVRYAKAVSTNGASFTRGVLVGGR